MGQSAERKRADRAEAAGPYPKPRGKAAAAGCPRFPTTTLRSASQMLLLALRRTSATVCAGAYRWATSGLRRRCRRSHGSQSAQSSPLGSVPAWVWGEVRSVPPPSSSDGGGTGRSSSGRRRLGGDSTAGGASALQTVRHDHLKPQTRVPIPPSLDTRTDICLSHSQVARQSTLAADSADLYGARLQGHGRRTSGHHAHYSGGAPSLRRADVRWRFGRVHVRVGARHEGPARRPRSRPSCRCWWQRVGRWMDVRTGVPGSGCSPQGSGPRRPNSGGARGCRHPTQETKSTWGL